MDNSYNIYELYERRLNNMSRKEVCVDFYDSGTDTSLPTQKFVADTSEGLVAKLMKENLVLNGKDRITTIPAPRIIVAKEGSPMSEPGYRESPIGIEMMDIFIGAWHRAVEEKFIKQF